MSTGLQNDRTILPEYAVDNLGTAFKVILVNSAERFSNHHNEEVFIPDYSGLIKSIAVRRAAHPRKLQGSDIRFLRKTLSLKSKELAEKLDISAEHLSRCEAGDKVLSLNSEKVLRSLVLLEAAYVLRKAVEDFDEDKATVTRQISKILDELKDIVSGMTIAPVHSADDQLVLYFKRVIRSAVKKRPANDSGSRLADWLDEAA